MTRARGRRTLVMAGAVLLGLAALYGLWLRDSSLVRVEHVEVSGLTGRDAPRLHSRLVSAARRMTTLNVRTRDLEDALAGHPALRRVEASSSLPHTLRIRVVEHRAVARLQAGRRPGPAVAADGTLLHGLDPARPLAVVRVGRAPSTGSRRLRDRRARRLVRVLAAAPAPLVPRLAAATEEPGRGVVLRLRRGPEVVIGPSRAIGVKWAAAARILADPASRGASYVDVRLPERPVAGGLGAGGAGHAEPAGGASSTAASDPAGAAASNAPQPTPAGQATQAPPSGAGPPGAATTPGPQGAVTPTTQNP